MCVIFVATLEKPSSENATKKRVRKRIPRTPRARQVDVGQRTEPTAASPTQVEPTQDTKHHLPLSPTVRIIVFSSAVVIDVIVQCHTAGAL